MRKVVAFYQKMLKTYPLGTQVVQTGTLMATGDLLAQTAVERKPLHHVDFSRVLKFGAIGTCLAGPALFGWYKIMDKYIKGPATWKVVLSKVTVDQLLFAPSFIIVIVAATSYSQGLTTTQVKEKLKDSYLDILLNNYKIWPLVQMCNFYLVPFEYRILVVQIVAIFWNCYLSWRMNRAIRMELAKQKTVRHL